MTTFSFGLLSGVPLVAALNSLSQPQLQAIFGVLAGVALGLTFVYLYCLANQPHPAPSSTRRSQRRPVRRAQRYPASWPLAGQMALQGGAA